MKTKKFLALMLATLMLVAGIPFTALAADANVIFAPGTADTTGAAITESYAEGTAIALPECTFAREGFAFAGWYDGANVYAAGAEYTVQDEITFTPVWTNTVSTNVYYSADGNVDTNGDGIIDVVGATKTPSLVGSSSSTGNTATMNIYSGTANEITCIASGSSATATCDSIYNIYGGTIGHIFGVSRYTGGTTTVVHTLNGNNTYNLYGGNYTGVLATSYKMGSVINGILTFNVYGGTFTSGNYFRFGGTQWSPKVEINGAMNYIINNKEIAENGGTLAGIDIGAKANTLTKYNNLIIVMNNAEYASQSGAVVSANSIATHTLYVTGGKAQPVFNSENALIGFDITPDIKGCVPVVNGAVLERNAYRYYDLAVGTTEITFAESKTATYLPGTEDTVGEEINTSFVSGAAFTLPECTFAREGFAFAGWYDGTATYAAGTNYTAEADVSFTPVWKNTVSTNIYYSADGNVDTNGDGIVDVIGTVTTSPIARLTYDGTNILNIYSGSVSEIASVYQYGGSTVMNGDTVFNLFGGEFGEIYAVSRNGMNSSGMPQHTVNGNVTVNVQGGTYKSVIAATQRSGAINGNIIVNINGGIFAEGSSVKFGGTQKVFFTAPKINGSHFIVINNKEIAANGGSLAAAVIGSESYAVATTGSKVIVVNNAELSADTGASPATNVATHFITVTGGKAEPKFNSENAFIGFDIISDKEDYYPAVNGMMLSKNANGYYDIAAGTTEISFILNNAKTATFKPGTNDTVGDTFEVGIYSGTPFTLPECTFTREGFAFAGWYHSGVVYEAGAEFTANSDVIFTPVWKNTVAGVFYYGADGKIDTNGDGIIDVVEAKDSNGAYIANNESVSKTINVYSGECLDLSPIATGTNHSISADTVYNIYGGTIGHIFGVSRYAGNNDNLHTVNGDVTINIYDGTITGVIASSMKRSSVLNGILNININGGKFTGDGAYFRFGATQWSGKAEINGAMNYIINNKEIAENGGSLAGVEIGTKAYTLTKYDNLIIVMNNAEYASQSGAEISANSIATRTVYVTGGKAEPKFNALNELIGFDITPDEEGLFPAINGTPLAKNAYGYYDLAAGVSEISFTDEVYFTNSGEIITFYKDMELDLATIPHAEKEGKMFIGWTNAEGEGVTDFNFVAGDVLNANYIDFDENDFYIEGAQLRLKNEKQEQGLRFIVRKNVNLETLPAVSEYGSVIVPSLALGKSDDVTLGGVYIYNDKEYAAATVPAVNIFSKNDAFEQYTVCVIGIKKTGYAKMFTVRGYISYTDLNGFEKTLYTDYYATNLVNVAQAILDDENVTDEDVREHCASIIETEKNRVREKYNNLEKLALSNNYNDADLVADVSLDAIYQLGEGGVSVREVLIETDSENTEAVEIFQLTDLHFNYVNDEDFEEANPSVMASYNGRQWLKDGESLPNAIAALEYASQGDAVVITGDVIDFMSRGAVELTRKYIFEPYPKTLVAFGNHDFERRCQDTPATPDPTSYQSRYDFLQENWNHNVYYTSRVIKDKVMIIQLENGTTKFWSSQIEPLAADLALARENGYTVLVFYHIPLATNNPDEKNVYPIRRNDTYNRNFCDNGVGSAGTTDAATLTVYDIITNNADVIKGTFCGHFHSDYKTEIIAKNADGTSAVIPQWILTGNPYDGGHALKITVK